MRSTPGSAPPSWARRTFDLGHPLWGGTPWAATPTFVVTHHPRPDFDDGKGGAFVFCDLPTAVSKARDAAGDRNAMVLGPGLGRQMMAAGLIDELRLQIVPVLLGGGTRLFEGETVGLVPEGDPVAGRVIHQRYRVKAST